MRSIPNSMPQFRSVFGLQASHPAPVSTLVSMFKEKFGDTSRLEQNVGNILKEVDNSVNLLNNLEDKEKYLKTIHSFVEAISNPFHLESVFEAKGIIQRHVDKLLDNISGPSFTSDVNLGFEGEFKDNSPYTGYQRKGDKKIPIICGIRNNHLIGMDQKILPIISKVEKITRKIIDYSPSADRYNSYIKGSKDLTKEYKAAKPMLDTIRENENWKERMTKFLDKKIGNCSEYSCFAYLLFEHFFEEAKLKNFIPQLHIVNYVKKDSKDADHSMLLLFDKKNNSKHDSTNKDIFSIENPAMATLLDFWAENVGDRVSPLITTASQYWTYAQKSGMSLFNQEPANFEDQTPNFNTLLSAESKQFLINKMLANL